MEDLNSITDKIILAAIRVHRELGPGLLESAYEACLVYELSSLGLRCERQKECPINYMTQVLSYLKLSWRKLGLLINFNVDLLKNRIKRIAN